MLTNRPTLLTFLKECKQTFSFFILLFNDRTIVVFNPITYHFKLYFLLYSLYRLSNSSLGVIDTPNDFSFSFSLS